MTPITIGRTTYQVEQATTDADTFFLTGPRGATLVAVPFINDPTTYHAFRANGSHADLKVNGELAKFPRPAMTTMELCNIAPVTFTVTDDEDPTPTYLAR